MNHKEACYRNISEADRLEQERYAKRLRQHYAEWQQREGRPASYCIHTFGCQQNESDSEIMSALLQQSGLVPGSDYASADLVLLNTCSIRENADTRLFGHLGQLKALAKTRPLLTIVCGCMMAQDIHRQKIRQSFANVDIFFAPQDLWRLPELLWQRLQGQRHVYLEDTEDSLWEEMPVRRERKFRALVSIMYGCNNFCTYCIVPYTRGRERSRSAASILKELRELAAAGYQEVMLLGQNVNAWGETPQDRDRSLELTAEASARLDAVAAGQAEARNFAELLTAAAQIDGLRCIRYMSSHPRDFSAQLIEAIRRYPNIENHLHLPLQSGSDRVLKKMNRHYDRQRFKEIVERVRTARPGISLTTDIIVAFPGEEEEDFQETLDAIRLFRFESAFTFIYSPREGTPAARWEQIPTETAHERFDRLVTLQNAITAEVQDKLLGQTLDLLLEGLSGGDKRILTGRDSAFHLVNVRIPDAMTLPAEAYLSSQDLNPNYFEGRRAKVIVREAKCYSTEAELISLN